MTKNIVAFFIFVGLSQLAGIVGSFFTMGAIPTWYADLVRPELAPPNWVFGPVWTILYLLMGIAAWMVWRQRFASNYVKSALIFFFIQLVLNSLWSIIFFGWQHIALAFAEIIVLWIFIVITIKKFSKVSKLAAWLLVPYILWVSFAAYLNFSFLLLN